MAMEKSLNLYLSAEKPVGVGKILLLLVDQAFKFFAEVSKET